MGFQKSDRQFNLVREEVSMAAPVGKRKVFRKDGVRIEYLGHKTLPSVVVEQWEVHYLEVGTKKRTARRDALVKMNGSKILRLLKEVGLDRRAKRFLWNGKSLKINPNGIITHYPDCTTVG